MTNTSETKLSYAWYVVFLLTLANISSFLDRQILALLVQPIKRDFHLSDTKISLLMGLSFGIFYTIFGMFIGRMADRYSRRNIIMGGVIIWSFMTALCAGIRNYSQFFLARIGVGVGEATLSPSAYSMIADYFPKSKLGIAMSVFSLGIFLGSGIALLIGAGLVANLPQSGMVHLPIFGDIFPWQMLFIYIGLPGFVIALLLLTVKEPTRKGLLIKSDNSTKLSLNESLVIIFKNKAAFLSISFGTAFFAFVNYGLNAWVPTMIARTFEWKPQEAGLLYGSVIVISSVLGVLWGGWYADKLVKNGVSDGRLRVSVIGGICILASSLIPLITNPYLLLISLAFPGFFIAANIGSAGAAVQAIMPNQVRSLASAIFLFILNMIGLGLGPTVVALFTDYIFQDEKAIKNSLVLLILIGGVATTSLFWYGLKPYQKAIGEEA
ncbi:spinster family MFS transporter [Emticicia sp. SJ17W-69]|uniref:spinster family MFS transporter n=1 Tax=Emticicia sp. SJ17W-69 TaxID=3421657 RepID=UPI003EC12C47